MFSDIGLFCADIGFFCGNGSVNTCETRIRTEQLIYMYVDTESKLRYRVAKTHRMPYLHRSFPAKEPYD